MPLLSVHFPDEHRWLMIFWVFTDLDRSAFVGAVVSLSFLILLYNSKEYEQICLLQKRTSSRILGPPILKFEVAINSHFFLFLEASKDFLFRLCKILSGSTRGDDGKGIGHAVSVGGCRSFVIK